MRPHIDQMRENIAKALGIEASQVNVKATTEEGLGFTGSGEGISAQAICLLTSPRELYSEDVSKNCGEIGRDRPVSRNKAELSVISSPFGVST